MIKWSTDKDEIELEDKIAYRAVAMAAKLGIALIHIDVVMDIDGCHSNGCPLKLAELLSADDSNFAHDILGIRAHIDRKTGKLTDCFLPRYAQVQP